MKRTITLVMLFMAFASGAFAQTSEFTYQGSLKSSGTPANGNFDLEFKLFDVVSAGTQQGSTLQRLNVAVANGIFMVSLDFGAGALPGGDRFLDIAVRTAGGGAFTAMTPRQKVTSAPYAVKSLNAATSDTATNATQLGGVAAAQYVVTTDPRMIDSRSPTAGSAGYVQNGTSQQAASNFNISSTGAANLFDAATQYNIGGNRILSTPGTQNVFAGLNAGSGNTTGGFNSFFGTGTGFSNTSGELNAFFGQRAAEFNTLGSSNAFFGQAAGRFNTTGDLNSFFGQGAGFSNTSGSSNTAIGANAQANGASNSTAIGAGTIVSQSNSLVLGNNANVGIGTTAPTEKLHVVGNGLFTGNMTVNGTLTASGAGNVALLTGVQTFSGAKTFAAATTFNSNVGIGTSSPASKLHVDGPVRVTNGYIYVTNPNTLIITSPNGACWGITANNSGALSTFPVSPCP